MNRRLSVLGMVAVIVLVIAGCGGSANPAPGANFSGQIDLGDKAENGEISFQVSDDGAKILNLSVVVMGMNCDGMTVGKTSEYLEDPSLAISGGFSGAFPALGRIAENYNLSKPPFDYPAPEDLAKAGSIEGSFRSATRASGTITLFMWAIGTEHACELGTFSWEAQAP